MPFSPVLVSALAGMVCLLNGCQSSHAQGGPSIEFSRIPPAGDGSPDQLATIEGRVNGARPGERIVLFARSGVWWVQPVAEYALLHGDPTGLKVEEFNAPRSRVCSFARRLALSSAFDGEHAPGERRPRAGRGHCSRRDACAAEDASIQRLSVGNSRYGGPTPVDRGTSTTRRTRGRTKADSSISASPRRVATRRPSNG